MRGLLNSIVYTKEAEFRPHPFPSVIVYLKRTTYFLGVPIKSKVIKYESKSNR